MDSTNKPETDMDWMTKLQIFKLWHSQSDLLAESNDKGLPESLSRD